MRQLNANANNNCTFDLKVYNAQRAGFAAAIVYNYDSDILLTMSSSNLYSIRIPSVFVGQSTGLELRSQYTYKNNTYVVISPTENDLTILIIPFICVLSVCILLALAVFVNFLF